MIVDVLTERRTRAWAAVALVATLVLSAAWCLSAEVTQAHVNADAAQGRLDQQQSRLETAQSHADQSGWDADVQKRVSKELSDWATGNLAWSAPESRKVPPGCEVMASPDSVEVSSVDVRPEKAGTWLVIVTRTDGTWAIEVSMGDDGTVSVTSCLQASE